MKGFNVRRLRLSAMSIALAAAIPGCASILGADFDRPGATVDAGKLSPDGGLEDPDAPPSNERSDAAHVGDAADAGPGARVEKVVTGLGTTCALLAADGRIRCVGANNHGVLGRFGAHSATPVTVDGAPDATDVCMAADYACASLSSGKVVCWGSTADGRLGRKVAAEDAEPAEVIGLSGPASAVWCGGAHACAKVGTGLECWGDNARGQLGQGMVSATGTPARIDAVVSPSSVAIGVDFGLAKVGAVVKRWGVRAIGTAVFIDSTPALLDQPDILGVYGAGISNVRCATLTSGALSCWGGANEFGQAGPLGANDGIPRVVPGVSDAVMVAPGDAHTCALLRGGSVVCWGANDYGQLGVNGVAKSPSPLSVSGLVAPVAISAGGSHTCVRSVSGAVFCWGANTDGQLGPLATTGSSTSPILLPF